MRHRDPGQLRGRVRHQRHPETGRRPPQPRLGRPGVEGGQLGDRVHREPRRAQRVEDETEDLGFGHAHPGSDAHHQAPSHGGCAALHGAAAPFADPACAPPGGIGYQRTMVVLVALGAFLMTLAGGWTAQYVADRRHLVLGFAGGLMLGVVGFDLLPEALDGAGEHVHGVPAALLLFVGGFLAAHVVERLLALRQAEHGAHQPDQVPQVGLGAAAAMVGHSIADGVAIGASFQVNDAVGLTVALAVVMHDFADGFNTYTVTRAYGGARRSALAMLFADALAPVVGAASTVFVTIPEQALACYLGFFGGVLLYIAAAEILPEASHRHPARSTLLCTAAGVCLMWLVVGAAGH